MNLNELSSLRRERFFSGNASCSAAFQHAPSPPAHRIARDINEAAQRHRSPAKMTTKAFLKSRDRGKRVEMPLTRQSILVPR
jgi:hypothetical protein